VFTTFQNVNPWKRYVVSTRNASRANAPLEIPVHRQEVYEKMQNEEVLMSVG
jgi:hypothetical protein